VCLSPLIPFIPGTAHVALELLKNKLLNLFLYHFANGFTVIEQNLDIFLRNLQVIHGHRLPPWALWWLQALTIPRDEDGGLLNSSFRIHRKMRAQSLIRPAVLIFDEIGYVTLNRESATLLFDLVSARYTHRKPIILTSNKSWGSWGEILPDRVMASAILDRLLHYSVTINIAGDSFRLLHHRQHGTFPGNNTGREESGAQCVAFKPANLSHP